MNLPQNIKSPRASFVGGSINSQLGDVTNLQQAILEKDHQISNLQGTINRLEMKNKQYSSYQQAMVEYEARAEQAQAELLKTNQKLRAKISQCDQFKKKLDQQLKQKKQRASSYVRHEDYMKLTNQYKHFRQVHKSCQNSIKQMESKNEQVDNYINDLKKQIDELNEVINQKNVQINSLKVQKYNVRSSQSIESQKQLPLNNNIRQSANIISSFRVVGEENNSSVSISGGGGDMEKMNYELLAYSRENDELRSRCNKLEQEIKLLLNSEMGEVNGAKGQYAKVIEEYEATVASMATKLSAVHRLEMEKSTVEQERRRFQIENEELRQDLASRISYCEMLQKKLREIEHYQGVSMQTEMQAFVIRSQKLNREVEKLDRIINEKYEQIVELRKNFTTLQITEETFRLMQQNLNSLEERLKSTKEQLRVEQDKVMQEEQKNFKLQKQLKKAQIDVNEIRSQMAKTNRLVSQKVQKIQFQSMEIKRLQKQNQQKKQLSQKLAKLQVEYRKLQKKLDEQIDESNELAMSVFVLSAEIERRVVTGNITKQFVVQFQNLKTKSKETEVHAKNLQQRVKRLEHLHKQVVAESMKVSQHLHISHKRWNHYDTAMDRLLQFLEQSQERSRQKYEQMDNNINTWLTLQEQRLKELAKSDGLTELAGDSQYVTYTSKITTEVMGQDGQRREKEVKVMQQK